MEATIANNNNMTTNGVRTEVKESAIVVSRVYKSDYQKEGTLTAELKQTITKEFFYPSKQVENSIQGNIFSLDEFGFKEDKYESTETRVAWIDVPVNSTVESVMKKLKTFPKARINKYLSNSPILSDTDKYAIDNPDLEVDLDTFANRQVVRYGANHENAGELILDRNGKVQYRRNAFSPSGAADVDIRSAEAAMYLSEEIRAEYNGVAMESQSI